MKKRLGDTSLWEEDWFRDLKNEYKLTWLIIKDKCDCIGIWRVSQNTLKNVLRKGIDLDSFIKEVNKDKIRISKLDGNRIILTGYLEFHYGTAPKFNSLMHKNLFRRMAKSQINVKGVSRVWLTAMQAAIDQGVIESTVDPTLTPYPATNIYSIRGDTIEGMLSTENIEGNSNTTIGANEKKSEPVLPKTISIEDKIVEDEKVDTKPERPTKKPARVIVEPDLKHPWDTDTFREAWEYWKDYKYRVHRFQYKDNRSENSMMEHLEELSNGHEDYAIKIIKYTEGRQWQGFQRPDNLPVPARKPTGLFAEIPASNGEATLFKDSPDFDKTRFCAAFQGTEYEGYNAAYYHEALLNWSDSKGAKVLDWIAQARSFMMRDAAASRAVLNEGVTLKSNLNGQQSTRNNSGVRVRPGDPEDLAALLRIANPVFGK